MSFPKQMVLCACGNVSPTSVCPTCRSKRNRVKRVQNADRYNADFKAVRKAMKVEIERAGWYWCSRGSHRVERAEDGTLHFDADHLDDGSIGASCPFHNRSIGGKNGFRNAPQHIQQQIKRTYE